jgi:hypothetical protein
LDIFDSGFEREFAELTEPGSRSDRFTEVPFKWPNN